MRTSEIMEMSGDHPFSSISKKRSHTVTPGFAMIDDLRKVLKHVQEAKQISRDNRKKLAMMAQQIIDSLKHEN